MRKVRSLLSVLLVCCLLVNVVPVKSKAVGATAAVVGVSAAMVAASALIGLGVSPGEDSSVFTGIVQNLVDGLETAGYVAGGLINVFSPANGGFKYGISLTLLNFIRQFLFEHDILKFNDEFFSQSLTSTDSLRVPSWAISQAANAPYAKLICVTNSTHSVFQYYLGYSFTDRIFCTNWYSDGSRTGCSLGFDYTDDSDADSGFYYYRAQDMFVFDTGSFVESSSHVIYDFLDFGYTDTVDVVCSSDFDAGVIHGSTYDYTDWAANSTTIPAEEAGEDEDVIVYPIGLGPDYDNTISKPQEDIWAGTSEYEIEAEGDSETGTGTETGLLSSILSAVKSIPSAFEGWFKDLIDLAGEIGDAIIGLPARIKEALTSLFQDVVNVGQAVVDAVLGIPQAIADVLTAIFVPDQAYVASKVDAVYAQFPFIQSIIATGEELKGAVSGSSGPPVIYVDLGLAPSGDFGSQKVLLTDFSWYEPYKQRVDTLLSAALWALFGWRMYLRLPSIISGEGGIMIASERSYRKLGDD